MRLHQQPKLNFFLKRNWLDKWKSPLGSRQRCGPCKFRHRNNHHIRLKTSRRSWIDLLSTHKSSAHIAVGNLAKKLLSGTFQFVLTKIKLLMWLQVRTYVLKLHN
jgi:hypothetical protein